jgi:hypothetical protein
MPVTLSYGNGAICELDSSQVIHVRPKDDRSLSSKEINDQFRAALAKPVDYPPLANATVPGDRVVIAIPYGILCPVELVEGALAALQDAGIEPLDSTLLLSHGFSTDDPLREQMAQLANSKEIALVVHDPAEVDITSIVGVTRTGRPLRLNRLLFDADLVLSLGTCTLDSGTDQPCEIFRGLFPVFSDQETIEHYRAPIAVDSKVIRSERRYEINESGWLLGVGLTIQIVPSPSGGIAAIFAGEPRISRYSTHAGTGCPNRYRLSSRHRKGRRPRRTLAASSEALVFTTRKHGGGRWTQSVG